MRLFPYKVERIELKTFMQGKQSKRPKPLLALSFIPIHPAMFIDTTFIMIAGSVILVALLERGLANTGHVVFAEAIHTFLKIVFPIVGLAAMYILIKQLTFM